MHILCICKYYSILNDQTLCVCVRARTRACVHMHVALHLFFYYILHKIFCNISCQLYELIYQLNAIEYLLCTFSSTCFGLTRPSSGAMDVIISLHMQHMVSLV